MSMRKSLGGLKAGIVLLAGIAIAGGAIGKTLRFADFGPNRGDRAAALMWFADEVKKRSGGSLEIEFHWGGALFSTKASLKGVADGVADMGSIVGFMTPKELQGYNLGDLPVDNADEWIGMRALYKLATGDAQLRKEFDKAGVVYVSNYTTGPVQLICKKEVKTLADLKGQKVRASGPYGKAFTEIGASVQSMAQDKVFQALDTGLIDCNQNYFYSIMAYKQYEVAQNVVELDWGQNMSFGIVMNKGAHAALTDAEKRVLAEVGSAFIDRMAQMMVNGREKDKRELVAGVGGKTIKVSSLPAADRTRLLAAGHDQVNAWVTTATAGGLDAKGLLAAYERNITEFAKEKSAKGYPWAR